MTGEGSDYFNALKKAVGKLNRAPEKKRMGPNSHLDNELKNIVGAREDGILTDVEAVRGLNLISDQLEDE